MSGAALSSPLFHTPLPAPAAPVRLFCLPYAGGGAGVYREWPAGLPEVEVVPVRLPGRETRFHEEPYLRMGPLVADLTEAIAATERPFALFGHSMGARIAFEVTRRLRATGGPQPRRLFVSACRAPQLPLRAPTHHLDDEQFVRQLGLLGGAPDAFFAEPELVELLLPMLRADFAVVETYVHTPEPPLDVPIHAFCGTSDPQVSVPQTAAWAEQTGDRFTMTPLPGGHFYLDDRREALLAEVRARLAP